METNMQSVGGVTVVELLGDSLDMSNSEDVMAQFSHLATVHPKLLVDLGRVQFLDSAGCGALMAGLQRFREAGGDMRVCRPNPPVKTVLDIARVARVLPVYDTREHALAAFGS